MGSLKLSVIIVNYNGKKYVDACVASIFMSKTENFEIIVVDNGSQDGSVVHLKEHYGHHGEALRVLELDKNYGPALARNRGAALARGKYLAFLDNDTHVDPSWTKLIYRHFEQDPRLGIVQCKLLLAKEPNKIDYVGEYIGSNGFLIQRANVGEIDHGQFDQEVEILAAKSAGMFIRKEAFENIGGFDDDYFIYVEETDLGWRCWLSGYSAKFLPQSIVYHEFGTSSIILGKNQNNLNAKFHGCKNYILTIFKNVETRHLFTMLPFHVLLWQGLAWYALFRGDRNAFGWIYKGIAWNLLNIRRNWHKRKNIQNTRKITDAALFKIVMKRKPFRYFLSKATGSHKVGNAEGFMKSGR